MTKATLSPAVKRDLDYFRKLVETKVGSPVLEKDNRQSESLKAQRFFVKLLDLKYGLRISTESPLLTQSLLSEYIGYDNPRIINFLLNNFNFFFKYDPLAQEQWLDLVKTVSNISPHDKKKKKQKQLGKSGGQGYYFY